MPGWLVLSRKVGEVVQVGPNIQVQVQSIASNGNVRLAFNAPVEVNIVRTELLTDEPATDRPLTEESLTKESITDEPTEGMSPLGERQRLRTPEQESPDHG